MLVFTLLQPKPTDRYFHLRRVSAGKVCSKDTVQWQNPQHSQQSRQGATIPNLTHDGSTGLDYLAPMLVDF